MADQANTTPAQAGEGAIAPKPNMTSPFENYPDLHLTDTIEQACQALHLLEFVTGELLKDVRGNTKADLVKASPWLGAMRIYVLTPEEEDALTCAFTVMSERFDALVKVHERPRQKKAEGAA